MRRKTRRRVDVDDLVDTFVRVVNSTDRASLYESDVTPTVVTSQPEWNSFEWQVVRCDMETPTAILEHALAIEFPPGFRSLVSRFAFPSFESGQVMFFGNTPEGLPHNEYRTTIFADELLQSVLRGSRFLQFARPAFDTYDPVCFDLRRRDGLGDCPVVQIDHEAILCEERIEIVRELCGSFGELLEELISKAGQD